METFMCWYVEDFKLGAATVTGPLSNRETPGCDRCDQRSIIFRFARGEKGGFNDDWDYCWGQKFRPDWIQLVYLFMDFVYAIMNTII